MALPPSPGPSWLPRAYAPAEGGSAILRGEIGADLIDSVVVTTGPYAYRRPDGVAVVPLALLGP